MQAQGSCPVLSLTSALLKELLCGPLTVAPSPGEPVLRAIPLLQKPKVSLRQGWPQPTRASDSFRLSFSLDLSWMVQGRVLQWYYHMDGGGMLLLLLPVILSLGRACSHCAVSAAGTTVAVFLHFWSSWFLS